MSTPAIAYLRVSGKSQVEGDGFPRQRASVLARAAANGMSVVAEFADEGISGASDLDDRPALIELFAFLENSKVRTVIVERADRLARDIMVSEVLLQKFREEGVQVIDAESGSDLTLNDPDNPTGTLIRQILAVVSQFEKTSIVSKLRKARQRKKAETGRCEGQKPYGTFPGEKDTLDQMLALRQSGLTVRVIVEKLNESPPTTRNGRPWTLGSVARILARHAK